MSALIYIFEGDLPDENLKSIKYVEEGRRMFKVFIDLFRKDQAKAMFVKMYKMVSIRLSNCKLPMHVYLLYPEKMYE